MNYVCIYEWYDRIGKYNSGYHWLIRTSLFMWDFMVELESMSSDLFKSQISYLLQLLPFTSILYFSKALFWKGFPVMELMIWLHLPENRI